jgi:pyruvate dehydrogenase (quinone)
MGGWNGLLEKVATTAKSPLRPQMVVRTLSNLLPDDAVISLDCGANTHFRGPLPAAEGRSAADRYRHAGHYGAGLSYAIAAYPDRPSVAVVGDGGFAMLMAELATAVANKLPVKVVILKNNSLAEVKFEQKEIGNPEFGCDLAPIDFVAFARACGAEGFRCERPEEVRSACRLR